MKKNRILAGAVVALVVALTTTGALAARQSAGQAAQENKPAQPADKQSTDKRAEALKKFLDAQRLEREENFPGAVAAYKEAIALDPQSVELRVALGSLYLKSRNTIDAESQTREALKLAPDNADAHKLLARIFIAQTVVGMTVNKDKARAAISELEAIVKLDPKAKLEIGDQDMPALSAISLLYLQLEEQDKALDAIKRVSEADAASDRAHYQLATLYFSKNKYREAAAAARKAYDLNQKQPAYASLLAKSLLRIGRTQEALEIYKKAIGIKDPAAKGGKEEDAEREALPTSPLVFDYAEALVFAGRYDEATKLLDPIVKNFKDPQIYLTAVRINATALRRAGKREDAVRVLETALKGQDVSESLPILFALAETYEEMQQSDKAVSTYEEALASVLNPDGTVNNREQDKQAAEVIMQRIGFAYRTAGKRDKAMETFERMKKVLGAGSPRADQLIIDTLINEGKYKEAFDAATAASARFPDEQSFKLVRAQAAGRLGDMQAAESTLRSLLKNSSEDSDIYSYMAFVQLEANLLKEAEESARKAISLEPNDVGPLVTLSSVQDRQKKYKDSEATLRKALEIDPDNANVLNNLGYFLADRGERLQEAEDLIRRAVNIEPTNGSYLDSLGWVLFKQGKIQDAQKYLEQAAIYSQRSAAIHDHLGDLYKKQGQMDKARAKWEEALKLSTEPEEIKKIKEKLGRK